MLDRPHFRVALIQIDALADNGHSKVLSNTKSLIRRTRPCSVILDLRYDVGGDYVNTFRFAHDLPDLVPLTGKIIVLTGPATFSAEISTAAFVKHAGEGRVVILGEAVGDRLQFFSEGGEACLPNYPLRVAYQTGKHDYQHACTDWRAGVDPVLDRAIALATARTHG